jgi:RNA polymerase sigma-B factor
VTSHITSAPRTRDEGTEPAPDARPWSGGAGRWPRAHLEAVHKRYAESRDPGLEAELLRRHEALAVQLSSRFMYRGEPPDDLLQVALLALLRALRRYDPGRGASFSTYAVPVIIGALKRHLRDQGWLVRPPRRVQDAYIVAHAAIDDLHARLGREPVVTEIADHVGLALGDIASGLEAGGGRYASPLPGAWQDDDDRAGDVAASDAGSSIASAEDRCFVSQLVRSLPKAEREVLVLSFIAGLTQRDIAAKLGISATTVCRLRRQGLSHLRIAWGKSSAAA